MNIYIDESGSINNHSESQDFCSFSVSYFDSSQNRLVQVADVFANFFYSYLVTGQYNEQIDMLKDKGIIKFIFEFPLDNTSKGVD